MTTPVNTLTDAERERIQLLASSANNLASTCNRILEDGWQTKMSNLVIDNRVALASDLAGSFVTGVFAVTAGDTNGDLVEKMVQARLETIGESLRFQAAEVLAEMFDSTDHLPKKAEFAELTGQVIEMKDFVKDK